MSETPPVNYFDHFARGVDLSQNGRRFTWKYYHGLFYRFLPKDQHVSILDFGCGTGMLLEWLKEEGFDQAEGIDTDASQLAFAQTLNVKTHLVTDSIAWLKNEATYDVIFLTDVLEHVPRGQDIELLRALHASLKPGGILFVKVPNASSSFAARLLYIDPTHYRSYTEESLWFDMGSAGFTDIHVHDAEVPPRNLKECVALCIRLCFRAFRRVEALSEFGMPGLKIPLAYIIFAVGRKPLR